MTHSFEKETSKSDELPPQELRARQLTRMESISVLFGAFLFSMSKALAKGKLSAIPDKESGEPPFIDYTHALPNGKSLRNLGIIHIISQYENHKEQLHAAIDQCDVLLIEDHAYAFFQQCAAYALRKRKKVRDIDVFNSPLQQACESGVLAGGLGLAAEQLYAEWRKKKKSVPHRALHTRRNILRVFAGLGAAASAFEGFDHPFGDMDRYQSFLTRGRTAAMLDESLKFIESDNSRKYLLMTGKAHGHIIEEYMENPEKLQRDLERFSAQFEVFGRGQYAVEP